MAQSTKFKIRNMFADDTTRDIEFGPFDSDTIVVETLRQKIKNFDVNAIKADYLSEGGAQFAGITDAVVTTVDEKEINLNVNE